MAKLTAIVVLIAILTLPTLAFADESPESVSDPGAYWIKMILSADPIPGKESMIHHASTVVTCKVSEDYLVIHMELVDEVVDKDQGTQFNDTTTIIDRQNGEVITLDHQAKTATVTQGLTVEEMDKEVANNKMTQFADRVPNRSFEDALERFLYSGQFPEGNYNVSDLGEKPILGFVCHGALVRMLKDDETADGCSVDGIGGAIASGVDDFLDVIDGDDMLYEYWYSEDLGLMVQLKTVMLNAQVEYRIDEYENWTPTLEETGIPEGYEVNIMQ